MTSEVHIRSPFNLNTSLFLDIIFVSNLILSKLYMNANNIYEDTFFYEIKYDLKGHCLPA